MLTFNLTKYFWQDFIFSIEKYLLTRLRDFEGALNPDTFIQKRFLWLWRGEAGGQYRIPAGKLYFLTVGNTNSHIFREGDLIIFGERCPPGLPPKFNTVREKNFAIAESKRDISSKVP